MVWRADPQLSSCSDWSGQLFFLGMSCGSAPTSTCIGFYPGSAMMFVQGPAQGARFTFLSSIQCTVRLKCSRLEEVGTNRLRCCNSQASPCAALTTAFCRHCPCPRSLSSRRPTPARSLAARCLACGGARDCCIKEKCSTQVCLLCTDRRGAGRIQAQAPFLH